MSEKKKLFEVLQNLDYNLKWGAFEKSINKFDKSEFTNMETFFKFQRLARIIWTETNEYFEDEKQN